MSRHLLWTLLWILVWIGLVAPARAAPEVPAALESWRPWVLDEQAFRACPLIAGRAGANPGDYLCAWPGPLQIDAAADAAELVQRWRVEAESWVPLVGDVQHWPESVTLDGRAVPVLNHGGPALRLGVGSYEVRARIRWERRPQSLRVPAAVGLVELRVDGKAVLPVERVGDQLTLGRSARTEPEADSLHVRVFRRLSDDVPAKLDTWIRLQASGQMREESLGSALPEGFVPMALGGDWPARVDGEGILRVRVQPGQAILRLEARALAPLLEVAARLAPPPWPTQEIWSYAADPQLRVTVAEGSAPVDPGQADVPPEWRDLPAFILGQGDRLAVAERSRGVAADERNQLSLKRQIWLDFDGGGFFMRDHIEGTLRQGWRLDVAAPYALERAASGDEEGEPLLVTRGASEALSGVEWHDSTVDLGASLRVVPAADRLPASGWQTAFDGVEATLQLPPAYRLLGAIGVDRAEGSWTSRWTLLDVFWTAVLVLLAWRGFGVAAGFATLAYLLLGYHESGAPLWSLLVVLALALLLRELPPGRLARSVRWLRNAALVMLALLALPFAASQIRQAVHPQLEVFPRSGYVEYLEPPSKRVPPSAQVAEESMIGMARPTPSPASPAPPPPVAADQVLETLSVSGSRSGAPQVSLGYERTALLQTGPGEPRWTAGSRHLLSWSGLVLPDQEMRLVIAPPWLVRPLRIVLVALLAFLVWRLSGLRALPRLPGRLNLLGAALLLAPLGMTPPVQAQEFPPDSLLYELRTRLTRQPDCAPDCALLASAEIHASGDRIEVVLLAHAASRTALPLPADAEHLALRSLRVDGVEEEAVVQHAGNGWLALSRGVHRVELGFEAVGDKLALRFPLRPMKANFSGDGWEASGLVEQRLQGDTLSLMRARSDSEDGDSPAAARQEFAPFVLVERSLTFGQEWTSETTLSRRAPEQGGFGSVVPLLGGEHVTSAEVRVQDGSVHAAFSVGQGFVHWSASLDKLTEFSLRAPSLEDRAEVWRVRASPTWHIEFSGVPRVEVSDGGSPQWFEFHPLPGETLTLQISRPEPLSGASVAIDRVRLRKEPGQRAADSSLELDLRATRGGDHAIELPRHAEVLGVSRNGEPINVRPQDGRLSLGLTPGRQNFEIRFRESEPLGWRSFTPILALGLPAANIDLTLVLPEDRWLLATGGPTLGPAVLYWGELLVMLLLALLLARLPHSPLRLWQWILLGVGFSTWSWLSLLLVVGWLFALDWRTRSVLGSYRAFNLAQIGIAALTLIAVVCLFGAIQNGLLGKPDMHVRGLDWSPAHELRWFADRSVDRLPQGQVFSLPLWAYHLTMLAWSLWLASALIGWIRRGFAAWMQGGYWRAAPPKATGGELPAVPPAEEDPLGSERA